MPPSARRWRPAGSPAPGLPSPPACRSLGVPPWCFFALALCLLARWPEQRPTASATGTAHGKRLRKRARKIPHFAVFYKNTTEILCKNNSPVPLKGGRGELFLPKISGLFLAKMAKPAIFPARWPPEFPVNFFQPWGDYRGALIYQESRLRPRA